MSRIDYQSSRHFSHSADVQISLLLNGRSIPVAQLGPGFLLLDTPHDHPPANASIVKPMRQ